MKFAKYHALGNDYVVLDPRDGVAVPVRSEIERLCHRHYGIGADGILFGPINSKEGLRKLRIFNPDGSEAEKSGNGLRIFARYLFDHGDVKNEKFEVITAGGKTVCEVLDKGSEVRVDMGKACFDSAMIPVTGLDEEVVDLPLGISGFPVRYSAVTLGNPHCVIHRERASAKDARMWGPVIENDSRFPNRVNVQFLEILDRENIKLEMWERGAGYTLASGSSACASAAVAKKIGACDSQITAHMPGGELQITISANFEVTMQGAVTRVGSGSIDPEVFTWCV